MKDAEFRWKAEYEAQLPSAPVVRNRSGIKVEPLYAPGDVEPEGFAESVGYPGQYPFTRGIYPTMHRGRTWTQRQLIGLGTPAEFNDRVLSILELGATAVSLIPCNSVFRGDDCDAVDPLLLGTCGTVVNTVEHMDRALEGVDLGRVSTAMNDPSPFTLLAFVLCVARRRAACRGRKSRAPRIRATTSRTLRPTTCSTGSRCRVRAACCSITSRSAASSCPTGIRSRSSGSTCSKPARRPPRRWV